MEIKKVVIHTGHKKIEFTLNEVIELEKVFSDILDDLRRKTYSNFYMYYCPDHVSIFTKMETEWQ